MQMPSTPIVSIDGQIVEQEQAMISVTDHGFLYGDGVFEGIRFYGKRVLRLRQHLNRLAESATALNLPLPMGYSQMSDAIHELIFSSTYEDGYLRLIVTRGKGPLGIDPRQCGTGSTIIICDQLSMVPEDVRHAGARLIIASTRRLGADQQDSRIKSLNYLNQILGRLEANAAGADEAIVLNSNGFVAEGTADNIFIARDGELYTPPPTDGALEGITRGIVMELAEELGIPVHVTSLTAFDLYTADECFLTGTGAELIPVREIAGRQIRHSPGELFKRLEKAFHMGLQRDSFFL